MSGVSEDGAVSSPDEGGVPSNHDSSDGREESPESEAIRPPHSYGWFVTLPWLDPVIRVCTSSFQVIYH